MTTKSELIEALATLRHTSWAGWMEHLFSKCVVNEDGSLTIPAGYVTALRRQMELPYAGLLENEKQSDRDEVAADMPIIEQYVNERVAPDVLNAWAKSSGWRRPAKEEMSPTFDPDDYPLY